MHKIDFYGGTHGHFLELIANLFIYQIDYNEDKFFTSNGACHHQVNNKNYNPVIVCHHYSFKNCKFDASDEVIEIHCTESDMLIAITNSLIRAGDQALDLKDLEIGTIKKLQQSPKTESFLDNLITEHGVQENYPRSIIRNYFYSKFDSAELGVNMFNNFKFSGARHKFPFSSFFNFEQFCLELNKCAFFLNMDFYPTTRTFEIWKEFISINQGYQSQQKCDQALLSILSGSHMDISDFNVIEEAWLLYRISNIFRCYNHSILWQDKFLSDTKEISEVIFSWKKNN